jgi:5'-3' exonuclease
MDVNGNPIGGVFGFIRSLMYFVEKFTPTKIYTCWDGEHGSQKRRTILKEYKEGRKVPSLNRTYEFTPDELEKNKNFQLKKIKEQYLSIIPANQLEYEYTEADDIIALLCLLHKDDQKVIISSDKDFFQLLDKNTVCYNPINEKFNTNGKLLEEYEISAKNFAVARAIVGDNSDNLKGAKGVGLKSVAKLFPFLKEDKEYYMKDILIHSTNNIDETKKYKTIVESFDHLMKIYNIIQLKDSILPMERINTIKEDINKKSVFESIAFRILASEDFVNFDIDRFVSVFNGFFLNSQKS